MENGKSSEQGGVGKSRGLGRSANRQYKDEVIHSNHAGGFKQIIQDEHTRKRR
jgi:hypothetical protein